MSIPASTRCPTEPHQRHFQLLDGYLRSLCREKIQNRAAGKALITSGVRTPAATFRD